MTERVEILGIGVDPMTCEEVLDRIRYFVQEGDAHHVVTVNPEFVMLARSNEPFRQVLKGANLALADGIGVVWAARLLGHWLPGRVAGSDLVSYLARQAAELGWRLYFLGAAPGVAEQAASVLVKRYPRLRVAGTYSGSPARELEDAIVSRVHIARPDVLLVAYGAPAQDMWIARNKDRLGVPVAIGVGGALDFIAGQTRRAPRWVQWLGLEWLHRLIHQPWRWRRMLALPRFAGVVLLAFISPTFDALSQALVGDGGEKG